jgi:GNAT superfamily N-acetyltransferase
MTTEVVSFHVLDGEQALAHLAELRDLYLDAYAEPPYEWGEEHADLFVERFTLVAARHDAELVGAALGVTLQPSTPWWQNPLEPLSEDVTKERPNRTFALVELLVRKPWRRQHIAQTMHDMILCIRTEERATLTVLPEALPAQHAYAKWGWRKVGQKRNPLPGAPVFDVMVRELGRL